MYIDSVMELANKINKIILGKMGNNVKVFLFMLCERVQ